MMTNEWQRIKQQRLHDDLREIWALVTEQPGISVRAIGRELDMSHAQTRRRCDLLIKSGTLTQATGKYRTLQATIPLITITRGESPYVRDITNYSVVSGT